MSANTKKDARQDWTSPYPPEIQNGGLGVSLSCTTSTGNVSLGSSMPGNVLHFFNNGNNLVHVAWGTSAVTATTACFPIPAGALITVTWPEDLTATLTHVAGITAAGTTTLLTWRGYGSVG